MRLTIAAIGRIKTGAERDLLNDYLDRASAAGRPLGLGPAGETEIDNRALTGKSAESAALAAAVPDGARLCLMDERGKTLSSRDLAQTLGRWRDDGAREAVFVIGGADGLDHAAFARPDLVLSFGPMVWPHKLARVMLAEQLYRAVSILGGSPYHRD
ncbi:23S rRNA (pseudouridine(1915)-N(3))-methyltransferase RlmH [Hyphobacterium marinum]|uniref:Ribosomal RNA large subunit methyltransferase H n=1 Tax=Hyphobacterium marinum TaxID=3116574 RepID=A0ABU7LVT9_9PROT|nr:23S rRNA (pseudouridine(1915)-N(3))-methyltransferase RlmH [Hyphobacterium sp. Y6023]MEE2565644.1 23S rRNA (pseudouridine(1915)-N(3))-methyltransferase RlmH [Hyphobacterium sp. Y6023]